MRSGSPPKSFAFLCILVCPGNGATNLLDHRHQVALEFIDIVEVEHNMMPASAYKHLGLKGIILRRAAPPGAAMDEDRDRGVRKILRLVQETSGTIDVELFDVRVA